MSPLVSWSRKVNQRTFVCRDEYESMVVSMGKDAAFKKNHKGLRRDVCPITLRLYLMLIYLLAPPFHSVDIPHFL
jgi:hypothetical protein